MKSDKVRAFLLNRDKLISAHVKICILDLIFEQAKRDYFTVICRCYHQIRWIKSYTLHWSVYLKNLPFKEFPELDGVQDSDDSWIEAQNNVSIVIRSVFKCRDFTFAWLEDVHSAWFLTSPVVDHDVGAALAVETREN